MGFTHRVKKNRLNISLKIASNQHEHYGFWYNIHIRIEVYNMKKIVVELSDERLITPSGLALVGGALAKSDLVKRANRMTVDKKRSQPQIKNGDIFLTYIGLLCQGKPQFEAVKELHEDPEYFKAALGISYGIPSAETLRQRMDSIGSSRREDILASNVTMFKSIGEVPSSLKAGYIPVDLDVTPFDNSKTSKEGVSRTYKGYDGYAPMMAYIGTEGYAINAELRQGKQHCQNGTPRFLKETLNLSHQLTDQPLLIRMDSGNDAAENLGILLEDGSWYVVKRNMRRGETKEGWLEKVKGCCKDIREPREGKTVYVGSSWKDVAYVDSRGEKQSICMRIVYEVIERTIDKHGQILLVPDIEVNSWWTNLGWSDDEIIDQYHAHGESEQYHSEIKTDMDVERLPSGKFETNELVLELTILAYNVLRIIGQNSLRSKNAPRTKRPVKRRRLRTVISNLILIAGHVTTHARRTILSLGRSNLWRHVFMDLYSRLVTA